MPRLPIDYSKTLIYKIVHKDDYDNANVYIGSTTDFTRRKNEHKSSYINEKNKEYNYKKYQYIRANGGWDEWNMIEIEKYPCNDGNEARAREEYWRCHFNANLNSIKAFRTKEQNKEQKKEYYVQNKEQMKEYNKEYYVQNKEQRKEKIICECGCLITKINLPRHFKTQKHLLLTKQIKYEFVEEID